MLLASASASLPVSSPVPHSWLSWLDSRICPSSWVWDVEHLLITLAPSVRFCFLLFGFGEQGRPCHLSIASVPTHPGVTSNISSLLLLFLVVLDQACSISALHWHLGLDGSLLRGAALRIAMLRSIFPPHASSTLLPSCDSQKCFRTLPNAPHLGRRWKIASGLKPLLWRKKGGETVGILCLTSYFSSSPRMHLQSLSSFRIVKPPSSEAELALAFSLCLYLHVQSFPKTFHLVWGISFFSLCLSSVLDFELFEDKMWVSHLFISSV